MSHSQNRLTACATLLALATLAGCGGPEPGPPAGEPAPAPVIFDTDIMGDVDDVGTVAVLHALADLGEARILAMGVSAKHPQSPSCLDALNTYFGRPDIPIGVNRGEGFFRESRYVAEIAAEFPHDLPTPDDAPEAATLYRQALAREPDGSVVMITVGQLSNVSTLLASGPDDHSPLAGTELVRRKVRAWVCMGGRFPSGKEANLIHHPAAAAHAIEAWPAPVIFSGWEIGQEIRTGARLAGVPVSSPVRRAYDLYNGLKGRQSWDQTAVLYAVRHLDDEGGDLWDLHRGGYCHVFPDGANEWRESPDRDHAYLVEQAPPAEIARIIEELMLRAPGAARP